MTIRTGRRAFLAAVAGAAAVLPARAQQRDRMRRLGVLMGSDDNAEARDLFNEFRRALDQLGWVYGRNLQIDIRWGSDAERRDTYAKELVGLSPDVIFAGPTNVVLPLQRETGTIPIVFVRVTEPVEQGIVGSLARPDGNITGFSNPDSVLLGKWLQILKDMAPNVARVGLMISVANAASSFWYRSFEKLAPSLALSPVAAPIREVAEVEGVFQLLAREPNGGLVIPGDTVVE